MMTLDEAIAHAREVASRERDLYKLCPEDCDGLSDCRELKNGKDKGCNKCAEEHEQLADWLEELKALRIANPKGEWIYPYADIKIGGRRVGKRDKECSVCHRQFSNNLPWDANFCPYCGADMRGGDVI